jgi:hypothetical protein
VRSTECVPLFRALVAGVTLLALTACDDDPPDVAPPQPSTPASTQPVNLAAWVESLPAGEPPGVPYAVGTTLHLPGGERVRLDGTSVEIIGATPRGTMLLVERDDPAFATEYVWVRPNGTHAVLTEALSHDVQDAVVSPDGRWFARGDSVVDLRDGSVVAPVPGSAEVLTGWVAGGVVYDDRRTTYLWEPGSAPFALHERTWFPNRTDVGLVRRGRCRAVVHVYPGTDHTEEWGTQCRQPAPLTVSPGGEWILDRDLRLVDAAQEKARPVAGGPVSPAAPTTTYWESQHVVLIALPTGVVRCDALERTCERALDGPARLPLR